jgi:hypothetical protein
MINSDNIKNELTKIFEDLKSLNDIDNEIQLDFVEPKSIDIPDITNLFREVDIFHSDLLYEIEFNKNKTYNQKTINENFEKIEKSFLNYQLLRKDISNYEVQLLDKKTDYQGFSSHIENLNNEITNIRQQLIDHENECNQALLELRQREKDFHSDSLNSIEDLEELDSNNSSNLSATDFDNHPLHKVYNDYSNFSDLMDIEKNNLKNSLNLSVKDLEQTNDKLSNFSNSFVEYKKEFISKINSVKPILTIIEKDINVFLNSYIVKNKPTNKKTI